MAESEPKAIGTSDRGRILFPRWMNFLAPAGAVAVVGGLLYATTLFTLGASPRTTAVGYAPVQPVPYSHALHAGKLGMDCRYCHNTVERTGFAALPATQTCMNCHTKIWDKSDALKPVRDSWTTGRPVQWVHVHVLPNYVYFNHSAHVNHGVGCVECHGRIDRMDVVAQQQPLSMGWCLDCHRAPDTHLRPKSEITNLAWQRPAGVDPVQYGHELAQQYKIHDTAYMQSCYTCHR